MHTFMFKTVLAGALACASASATAADWLIYDDALANGFQDWSWGGGSDFANPAPVHSGQYSIALAGNNYNAISFARSSAISSIDWPRLKFWVHGGSSGGQALHLSLQNGDTVVAGAPLSAFLGGGPVAGSWRQVSIPFNAPPFSYAGPFSRINIQSDAAAAQPVVYFDDVALSSAENPAVDPIFSNGFEGGGDGGPGGLLIERDVAIDGLRGERYSWLDAAGQPRVAVLAYNNGAAGANGSRGGELREFRYQVGATTRVIQAAGDAFGGFGYVVAHPSDEGHCTGGGDPSSLGHFTPGQFQRVFEGRHHAILRFTQNYPRYCTKVAPAQRYDAPVTIDWLIANGRDDPLWSITWDLSAVPVDRLEDDSRAPYGQLRIDGAASDAARSLIGGVAWGDYYRFSSSGSPLTLDSAWSWNEANRVPFVQLWTGTVDAAMGIVQTQTIAQQDAGGYWGQGLWNRSSAQGSGCPGNYLMPCDYNWPFQSVNYELYGGATRNARLAWGSNFGFLGQQQYRIRGNAAYGGGALALPGDPMAPGWPKKSYSTWIALGTRSSDPVGRRITEVEAVQSLAISASTGSVAASGPRGVADATAQAYAPVGWDKVRGALTLVAAGNRVDAKITLGAGLMRHPLIVVRSYNGALPTSLRLDGVALVRDVDWLPSLRADQQELWVTLLRDLSGANRRLEIAP